ncbi:M56 family metallopeptidase [Tsuneonella sp. SYSU-LHT278]|uniref:M56 family metallopeptidase n=1 Tax=Tsuneonella sediminis TaxID=3416089 RepID=UPI003F797129
MTWLLDTLVWTGALITLVLFLRRPMARHFGARTAYALWLLPGIRLIMPPLVLPAPDPVTITLPARDLELVAAMDVPAQTAAGYQPAIGVMEEWSPLIETGLVAIWLAGAAIYIALRLAAYRRLRIELLSGARMVGEVGSVRLVETPATRSPLAFGVVDKVVALPVGFMALPDRAARDLALAHELAHHQAHDLAANFAALPLFALHWFNPLSWLGWLAMRRDQEAACDARVIAGCDRLERSRYAALIAGTAAAPAPRAALAAPMACPVLGDKSIIHRLRNLTMNEISIRRRRMGGAFIGMAALALPLTASISYAHAGAKEDRDAPAAPLPPPPPAAPDAPLAPPAPPAAVAPSADGERVLVIRKKDGTDGTVERRRVVIKSADGEILDPESAEFQARMKELEKHLADLDHRIEKNVRLDEKRVKVIEMRARDAAEHAARAHSRLGHDMARVELNCGDDGEVTETRTEDGRRVVRICRKEIIANASGGLKAARAAIAGDTRMDEGTRRKLIEELDREIERIDRKPAG